MQNAKSVSQSHSTFMHRVLLAALLSCLSGGGCTVCTGAWKQVRKRKRPERKRVEQKPFEHCPAVCSRKKRNAAKQQEEEQSEVQRKLYYVAESENIGRRMKGEKKKKRAKRAKIAKRAKRA